MIEIRAPWQGSTVCNWMNSGEFMRSVQGVSYDHGAQDRYIYSDATLSECPCYPCTSGPLCAGGGVWTPHITVPPCLASDCEHRHRALALARLRAFHVRLTDSPPRSFHQASTARGKAACRTPSLSHPPPTLPISHIRIYTLPLAFHSTYANPHFPIALHPPGQSCSGFSTTSTQTMLPPGPMSFLLSCSVSTSSSAVLTQRDIYGAVPFSETSSSALLSPHPLPSPYFASPTKASTRTRAPGSFSPVASSIPHGGFGYGSVSPGRIPVAVACIM